MILITNSRWIP